MKMGRATTGVCALDKATMRVLCSNSVATMDVQRADVPPSRNPAAWRCVENCDGGCIRGLLAAMKLRHRG